MPSTLRLARDATALILSEATAVAIPRLPARWRFRAGELVGSLRARVSRGDRKRMMGELRRSLGEAATRDPELAGRCYRNIWLDGVEPHLYPHLDAGNVDELVGLRGEENLEAGLAGGKGVLLLIGHFGLNTLTMAALGHRGYTINQISAPPTVWRDILGKENVNPFAFRRASRTWRNEQALPATHISVFGFLRPVFKALRRNEILCIAVDGGGGTSWTQVEFLGRTCNVSAGPASLALRTGAAVVPAVVLRHDDGRHTVVMEPPLEVTRTGDRETDERVTTQAIMDVLGRWVRERPDHYAGFLRLRMSTAPTDTVPFFADYGSIDAS